jgi:hypothetical protein
MSKSKSKKTIKVGTIDSNELMLKRKGKLNRNDGIVKTGTGVHTPKDRKKKTKQREKNSLRELYR